MSSNRSIIYEKSCIFALAVIRCYKDEFSADYADLFKQLLRSGTSIGANLAEATTAISKVEFSAKVSIAYKEIRETQYWLLLLKESGLLKPASYLKLNESVDELGRMAFSILKTTGRVRTDH